MSKEFKNVKFEHKGIIWQTFPDVCKSCGLCVEKCPVDCLSFDNDNVEYLGLPAIRCEIEKCIACKTCENACPDCAIRVDGKKK